VRCAMGVQLYNGGILSSKIPASTLHQISILYFNNKRTINE
jgi:hypothetical protein